MSNVHWKHHASVHRLTLGEFCCVNQSRKSLFWSRKLYAISIHEWTNEWKCVKAHTYSGTLCAYAFVCLFRSQPLHAKPTELNATNQSTIMVNCERLFFLWASSIRGVGCSFYWIHFVSNLPNWIYFKSITSIINTSDNFSLVASLSVFLLRFPLCWNLFTSNHLVIDWCE